MPIDLFVDHEHPRRTSASLFGQIREAIASGRLSPGDRLPTTRELARELGVARSTVATVYARLVAEGLLDGRVGDGTFIAAVASPLRRRPLAGATALAPRRTVDRQPPPAVIGPTTIDLRTGRPDPGLFPLTDWRRCAKAALRSAPPGYGDRAGLPALREAIATWVGRSRGVVAAAEQVLVTSGAQQAFDLLARVMLAPGDVIAIEDPGYPAARRAFAQHGLRVAPVPVDAEGIRVDAIPTRARAVYVTPSHQSPTGVTLSAERRRALLAFAARHGAAIIEDDYDSELRFVDRPLEPLQLLDTDGRVVYVGTFSKTLSPSLRIGFVVAPESVVDELAAARALVDAQPPHLTQAALAELIVSGGFERHLRRMHRAVRPRHELVTDEIGRLHADGVIQPPHPSNAGLHSLIELREGGDARELARRLAEREVAIDATDDWWVGPPRPGLLVGFGMADVGELGVAFSAIRDALMS